MAKEKTAKEAQKNTSETYER